MAKTGGINIHRKLLGIRPVPWCIFGYTVPNITPCGSCGHSDCAEKRRDISQRPVGVDHGSKCRRDYPVPGLVTSTIQLLVNEGRASVLHPDAQGLQNLPSESCRWMVPITGSILFVMLG